MMTRPVESMSLPPLVSYQTENGQFNTNEIADIGDDVTGSSRNFEDSLTFDPQAFMDRLGMQPTVTEEENESPVQYSNEEENDLGDALDDDASDDLTNALNSDTSVVFATSTSISSIAPGSPHSAMESVAVSLASPDHDMLEMTDILKMVTIDTMSMPQNGPQLESDGQPTPHFQNSFGDQPSSTSRSSTESLSHANTDIQSVTQHTIQSDTVEDINLKPSFSESVQASSSSSRSRATSQPSVLQRVVSKTRPPHLPPKGKDEDRKHNKEWEEMMQHSRMAEQARLTELQYRRLSRELAIEASTSQWERTVLPDWKKAVKDPEIQKLWWKGIPPKLRGIIWEKVAGNPLALSKDAYSSCLSRAKSLLSSRRFPTTALSLIESDISTTLPQLHIFHRQHGPLYEDLYYLLCAWVVARADEGLGYVEGIAKIGGMLLLNLSSPSQAFMVLRNLLERSCLRAFYGGHAARDDVEAYYRIFDTLLADTMPKVYFNFKQYQISPAEYLPEWIIPLFLNHLPIEACSRIWDMWLLEGDSFLFRTSLALLAAIESRLFFPDREELLAILKGESRAALEVAKRDPNSPLRMDQKHVIPRYEIYGLTEDIVWERVMESMEWWKESTWQRLLLRELPDA